MWQIEPLDTTVEKLTSILIVIDAGDEAHRLIEKAVMLAHRYNARLELFLCDSDQAHALRHTYDQAGAEEARQECVARGQRYLDAVTRTIAEDVLISTHVAFESPLYEAVVHRVQQGRHDLVMKSPAGKHPMQRITLDPNDWQLARTCPVPLMLTRSLPWSRQMRFVAAIDVPRPEGAELARSVLHTAGYLAQCCDAELDVVYSDREEGNATDHAMRTDSVCRVVNEFRIRHEHLHVLQGDPEKTLPGFVAQLSCDVMVLGALTRRNSISALVGTLTSELVDTLECDFVLVKPETYSCPVAEHTRPLGGSAGLQHLTT